MHAEMNVTPMLDVLLVLIIMFMAMLAARRGLDVHLPDPTAQQGDAVAIVLEVGPRGYYALNREVVPAADLAPRIRELYAGRPDKRIILSGARDATYQEVIGAIDIVKGAGVTVIGVDTRVAPPPRALLSAPASGSAVKR
jgi:biopolymer transport protein TolR